MKNAKDAVMVISYLTIRRTIGVLGMLIPFLLGFGALIGGTREILPSVSQYYYTNMQDLFVGILCAVSLFLVSYKGYPSEKGKVNWDLVLTNVAGIGALGVAFFPMALHDLSVDPAAISQPVGIFRIDEQVSKVLHFASAATFFVSTAVISLFLFTKTRSKKMTDEKRNRNTVYIVCGAAILLFLALIVLHNVLPLNAGLESIRPVFFLESLSLVAFGFAWLVKGETLWRDRRKG